MRDTPTSARRPPPELRTEAGLSVIELAFVILIFMIGLAVAGAVITTAMRTTTFAQQESDAIQDGRTATNRIERDIRSALDFRMCNNQVSDNCLELSTQLGDGSLAGVRYQVQAEDVNGAQRMVLRRWHCATDFTGCAPADGSRMLSNVALEPGEEIFSCITGPSQIVRVGVALRLSPLATAAGTDGTLSFEVSARPRNIARPTC